MKKNLDNLKLKSPKNVMDYVASYLLSEIKCIVLKNCLLRNDWPPFCRVSRSVPRVRHSTHPRTRQGIHAIYQKIADTPSQGILEPNLKAKSWNEGHFLN